VARRHLDRVLDVVDVPAREGHHAVARLHGAVPARQPAALHPQRLEALVAAHLRRARARARVRAGARARTPSASASASRVCALRAAAPSAHIEPAEPSARVLSSLLPHVRAQGDH